MKTDLNEILTRSRIRMLNTQEDIKRLNQRTLRITPTTQLLPVLGPLNPIADIIVNTPGQTSRTHILATSKERPQLVKEDSRSVMLIHPLKRQREIAQTIRETV